MKEVAISQVSDGSFIVREVGDNNQIANITTHSSSAKLQKRIKELFKDVEDEVDFQAEEIPSPSLVKRFAKEALQETVAEIIEERQPRQTASKKPSWGV